MRKVFLLAVVLSICLPAFAQHTVTSDFFGAGWNNISATGTTQPNPWCPLDSSGNIATLNSFRMWDDGVKWAQVEPTASSPTDTSSYTFTKLDWAMGPNVATHAGCNMKMLYQFGDTPQAPIAKGTPPNTCSEPNTDGCAPPADVNGDGTGADAWWMNFVGQLAIRYSGKTGSKGHMSYWGTWNEADSSNYWCSASGAVCGGSTASLKNLVLMAWDMYNITKCVDPTSKVISPDGHVGSMTTFIHNFVNTSINAPARNITFTPPAGSTYSGITCSWGAQTVTGKQTFDILDEHMRGTYVNKLRSYQRHCSLQRCQDGDDQRRAAILSPVQRRVGSEPRSGGKHRDCGGLFGCKSSPASVFFKSEYFSGKLLFVGRAPVPTITDNRWVG